MRLTAPLHSQRRMPVWGSLTGGLFGRSRAAKMFPAEAERLVTPAELKRLHA